MTVSARSVGPSDSEYLRDGATRGATMREGRRVRILTPELAREFKWLTDKARSLRAEAGVREPAARTAFRLADFEEERAERNARRELAIERCAELERRLEEFSQRDDADNRDRRVFFVIDLMTHGVFERGRTSRELAKSWGVNRHYTHSICGDAHRLLRALSVLDGSELELARRNAREWFGRQESASSTPLKETE